MTVRQYLGQVKYINMRIDRKIEELEQLRAETTRMTTLLKPDKVKTSPKNDKLAEQVAQIVCLENEIQKEVDNYYLAKKTIISQIENLDNEMFYNVLHLKYILFKTNNEIAEKLGYSLRQIMNINAQAILCFDEKYKNEIKKF